MDFRFVAPDLRALDLASAELLACCMWSDVRPARGVAGLVDFRLAGRLSELSRTQFLAGERGEVVFVPGRPKLPFEKILLFGLGARAKFDDSVYKDLVKRMSRALEQLHVVRAVVELPGRADGVLTADRAAELLVQTMATDAHAHAHDAWWLVEDEAAQRQMSAPLEQARRATRRA